MRLIRILVVGILATPWLILTFCTTASATADALKPTDLVGSWIRTGPATIGALEFQKNGKVSIYFGGGNDAFTADYTIRDDGRLDLSEAGAVDYFFLPTLSGEKLQLKEAGSGTIAQYRRLKPGEPIAQALAAEDQAERKSIEERNAAIPIFLRRKDLVLIIVNGGKAFPAQSAIEFAPNGNDFGGRIQYDSKPPRLEPLGAQIHSNGDNPSILVWFGPGTARQNRLSFQFHAAGTTSNITLVSRVSFGEVFDPSTNSTAIIKADADLHNKILGSAKAENERLNGLKTPIIAMLKDYAVIKGISRSNSPADKQGYAETFTLSRNPQNGTWVGQGQLTNRTTGVTETFPVLAGVGIVGEKPALQILSQKRLYQYSDIDPATGRMTGAWQIARNPQTLPAEAAVTQAVDSKARDQLFGASKTALQQLNSTTLFHALVPDGGNPANDPPNPVALTLSIGANGAVTGKADYPLRGCTMTIAGRLADTPLGPQLTLKYAGGQANPGAWRDTPNFINYVQHETWVLSPTIDSAGTMRLTGYGVTNPTPAAQSMSLELIPYTDKDKAALAKALADGVKFKLIYPKMGDVVDVLAFSADPATKKIVGRLTTAGHQINNSPNSTFTGEITEKAGWAELEMPIVRPVDHTPIYQYNLVVTPTDKGLYISAFTFNIRQGPGGGGRWDAVEVKP